MKKIKKLKSIASVKRMKNYSCIILIIQLFLLFSNLKSASAQEEKNRIAVLDFEAIGISELDAKALSEQLRASISQIINNNAELSSKYDLFERSQMTKFFEKQ